MTSPSPAPGVSGGEKLRRARRCAPAAVEQHETGAPPPGAQAGSPGSASSATAPASSPLSSCLLFFLAGICAPLIAKLYGKNPYDTYGQDAPGLLNDFGFPIAPNGGISSDFWFGIEPGLGRDVFTFLLYGIRNSLLIATATTVLVATLGVVVGITAGYLGGKTDYFIGRIIDILLAFPSTLFFIAFWPVMLSILVSPEENTPTWLTVVSLISVHDRVRLGAHRAAAARRGTRHARAGVRGGGQGNRRVPRPDHLQGTAAQPVDTDPHPGHPRAAAVRHDRGRPRLPGRGPDFDRRPTGAS